MYAGAVIRPDTLYTCITLVRSTLLCPGYITFGRWAKNKSDFSALLCQLFCIDLEGSMLGLDDFVYKNWKETYH